VELNGGPRRPGPSWATRQAWGRGADRFGYVLAVGVRGWVVGGVAAAALIGVAQSGLTGSPWPTSAPARPVPAGSGLPMPGEEAPAPVRVGAVAPPAVSRTVAPRAVRPAPHRAAPPAAPRPPAAKGSAPVPAKVKPAKAPKPPTGPAAKPHKPDPADH
jgi:hypothetical protein